MCNHIWAILIICITAILIVMMLVCYFIDESENEAPSEPNLTELKKDVEELKRKVNSMMISSGFKL